MILCYLAQLFNPISSKSRGLIAGFVKLSVDIYVVEPVVLGGAHVKSQQVHMMVILRSQGHSIWARTIAVILAAYF